MDRYGVKRNGICIFECREDHSRYPEGDYVVARNERVRGIEIFEVFRLIRPAHRREGPERGGEPGIQRIGILCQLAATVGANGGIFPGNDGFAAFFANDGTLGTSAAADANLIDTVFAFSAFFAEIAIPADTVKTDGKVRTDILPSIPCLLDALPWSVNGMHQCRYPECLL